MSPSPLNFHHKHLHNYHHYPHCLKPSLLLLLHTNHSSGHFHHIIELIQSHGFYKIIKVKFLDIPGTSQTIFIIFQDIYTLFSDLELLDHTYSFRLWGHIPKQIGFRSSSGSIHKLFTEVLFSVKIDNQSNIDQKTDVLNYTLKIFK